MCVNIYLFNVLVTLKDNGKVTEFNLCCHRFGKKDQVDYIFALFTPLSYSYMNISCGYMNKLINSFVFIT